LSHNAISPFIRPIVNSNLSFAELDSDSLRFARMRSAAANAYFLCAFLNPKCLDYRVAKVFLSPYMSNDVSKDSESGCAKSYAPLHDALRRGEWPYDYGDDPSFFCRRHLGGALTWGVCRADVRSQVQPGDVVVFFSFTKAGRQVQYRLSAIATVQTKLRQSDIFTNPLYKRYRRYLNLLIRPSRSTKGAWGHWEPGAPAQKWHDDWAVPNCAVSVLF
jgi:hypothetical protein